MSVVKFALTIIEGTSEILGVVRIHAMLSVMLESERTPNCFEMVQIEICVNFVFFDHFYRKL